MHQVFGCRVRDVAEELDMKKWSGKSLQLALGWCVPRKYILHLYFYPLPLLLVFHPFLIVLVVVV